MQMSMDELFKSCVVNNIIKIETIVDEYCPSHFELKSFDCEATRYPNAEPCEDCWRCALENIHQKEY